jgi:hypothetical protein
VQRLENQRQEEMEQLEYEEQMRRLEAEKRLASLKRKNDAQKVEAELKIEEARLKALEEANSGCMSSRSSRRSSDTDSYASPSETQLKSNLRHNATPFTPRTSSDLMPPSEELANALTKAIFSSRLPVPEPSIFTGDPMAYPDWVFSFTSLIENRGVPPAERIHYLKR